MKKGIALFTVIFAVSMLIGIQAVEVVNANPMTFQVPSMKIVSPPDPPNRYENSTVSLEVEVYMLDESPRIQSMYYSLDGGSSVYLGFTTLRNSSWWPDKSGYVVGAKVDLENLSEGNHSVISYSADSNGKVMSTSRTFSVDSHYQVTVIEILSPKNITYSTNEVPLVFTMNGEFKSANYGFLPPSPMRGNTTAVPIAAFQIDGNTTLTGLSDGFYRILLYASAQEKGASMNYLEFTINTTQANNSPTLGTQTSTVLMASLVTMVVTSVSLVYFKKHKPNTELIKKP
jgi:hypothetical protein